MSIKTMYMNIPVDLSGSISKNRFRVEILWGISKMLDLYDLNEFAVVFDNVCDIEVHTNDSLEFYQLKSQKGTQSYTVDKAISKKNESSVLGKLYVLKHNVDDSSISVKLAIVTNAYLKVDKKQYTTSDEFDLTTLSNADITKLENALKAELSLDKVEIKDMYFIHTHMNLEKPQDEIDGKIINSFEKINGFEPIKPLSLCRLIRETANTKASYEMTNSDYESVLKHKSITKFDLTNMFEKHTENSDEIITKAKKYIEDNYTDSKEVRKLKTALTKVLNYQKTSKELNVIENDISQFLLQHEEEIPNGDKETIADWVLGKYKHRFSTEYDNSEIYILIIIIIMRWEDGKYE